MNKKYTTVFAFLSGFLLMVLALLPRPFISMNHGEIMSGQMILSESQKIDYINYVKTNLTVDSAYLLSQFLMILGISTILRTGGSKTWALFGGFGVLSILLDLTENEMRWSIMQYAPQASGLLSIIWGTIINMSFWFIAISALILGISFSGYRFVHIIYKVICIMGVLTVVLSFVYGHIISFLWLIIWHFMTAVWLCCYEEKSVEVNST